MYRENHPGFVPVVRPLVQAKKLSLRERLSNGEVEWSEDFARILALPRRLKPNVDALVVELTTKLKRPEGTMTLRPIQAWALYEAPLANGAVCPVSIGGGKTLTSMLMPMVMPHCERAVLLIPPDLRAQFALDWKRYGQHWKLPNLVDGDSFVPGRPALHVLAYSELSHKKGTDYLERVNADLIIADECQALSNVESARGGRFFEYFPSRPWARFVAMSASITADSLGDFAHLMVVALGGNAPAPVAQKTMKEWASALDPTTDEPLEPGVLRQFCTPGEDTRSGIRRRLVDTLGVVASSEDAFGVPLVFRERVPPPMPLAVAEAYKKLKIKDPETGTFPRPDGEPLEDQLEVVACARSLSVGLYLRWVFPRGEPRELIDAWYQVRTAWNRELRAQLQNDRKVFMDSPGLCEDAAIRYYDGGCVGCERGPKQPHVAGCKLVVQQPLWDPYSYPAWREIRDLVYYESEAVWMDDWIARDAVEWMKEHTGIVWTEHPELGERISALSGCPYFGAGDDDILKEKGNRSIVASIDSHGKGKNLQGPFSKNLIVQPPASAETWEQCVGRTHRPGQTAAEVGVWYYAHAVELENALEKAQERAKYIEDILGSAQKLRYGKWERA